MNQIELDYDLLALLPPWYAEVLDYQQICQTEEQQLAALASEINAVAENFFFQTMGITAIEEWEQIFGIYANPDTETISFRQARLINRMSNRPPFTLQFLYNKLDELIGRNQWTVTMDYPNYTLYIESSASNQSYATELYFTINRVKPAHIVYVNKPYTVSGLLLSEQINLSKMIYHYRLGSWGLGLQPFSSTQPQGAIKLPTVSSIQPELLTDVASFISGDVASAQINGSIPISDLSKSVSGSTLTVTYTVQPTDTTQITSVALLDSSGEVLTSSTVYVPVTGPILLTHKIPVSEGVISYGG